MPNLKGGKKYKSSKHTDSKPEFHEIDAKEGQMVGRILKHLGDRNTLIYCNDGKERICHIRGAMSKKKCKLETGDVVLLSTRADLSAGKSGKEHGDILAKYDRETYSQLKKLPGINPMLFQQLEQAEYKQRAEGTLDDDYFEAEDESSEENSEDDEETKVAKREARDRKRNEERKAKETVRAGDDDDVNIDDI